MGKRRGFGRGRGSCASAAVAQQASIGRTVRDVRDSAAGKPCADPLIEAVIALVDAARCTGCGICVDACPDKAISVSGIAAVDQGRCVGCGACVRECPNEALTLGRVLLERGANG